MSRKSRGTMHGDCGWLLHMLRDAFSQPSSSLNLTRISQLAFSQDVFLATYGVFFEIYSISLLVSFAASTPSAKLTLARFSLREAIACNSCNSRCLAFNSPDLDHQPIAHNIY